MSGATGATCHRIFAPGGRLVTAGDGKGGLVVAAVVVVVAAVVVLRPDARLSPFERLIRFASLLLNRAPARFLPTPSRGASPESHLSAERFADSAPPTFPIR